jgi:hypothetical protein
MTKMTWTYITNVRYVDYHARLWCHAVLIDNEPRKGLFDQPMRQIRGQTWGGLDVFTIWIDPEAEVSLSDEKGGHFVMLSDDGMYNMDGGLRIEIGDIDLLFVSPDDYRQPIKIEKVDHVPFGDEVDRRLLKFSGGTAYPRIVWTHIRKKEQTQ